MTIRAFFWVEAGSQAGLGHLQRCLSLALALKKQRMECIFQSMDDPAIRALIRAWGFAVKSKKQSSSGIDHAIQAAKSSQCRMVIVDSYRVGKQELGQLRRAGFFVVAIDDLARFPFVSHLVVNGAALAEQLPYRSVNGDTRFLLGPTYVPLRPEFWRQSLRRSRRQVRRILITVGGADPHCLLPSLVKVLDSLTDAFKMTVVTGPFVRTLRKLSQYEHLVNVIQAPNRMRHLMMEADLAVSGGGQTLYELAACGTPTIALELASNQAHNLRSLKRMGVIQLAGSATEPDFLNQLRQITQTLLKDWRTRSVMSAAGQQLVDGRGAERVARVIRDQLL